MKVYVVYRLNCVDGCPEVLAVYTNKINAEKEAARINKEDEDRHYDCNIAEKEVLDD